MKPIQYRILRDAGKLTGTIKAAKAKRKARYWLRQGHPLGPTGFVAIPLGADDENAVYLLSRKERPRVQRWVSPAAEARRSIRGKDGTVRHCVVPPAWGVGEDDAGSYKGRFRKYRKIDYTPVVASYGRATVTRLYASIWAVAYKHRAPCGWHFGTDYLGIYLVRKKERRDRYRYHLTSDDVRGGLAVMRVAAIDHEHVIRRTARIQRATARRQKADAAKLRGVEIWVGLEDSRAAGNCRAGTVAWAGHHGLDHGRHYPARVIQRLERHHLTVGAVIEAARRRTLQDLDRGFCAVA